MDGPLTLLYYSCINLIILFVLSKNFDYLFFGALLISLTAITKQQGFILPAIFFVSGILFVKNKILSLKLSSFIDNCIQSFYFVNLFL